MTKRIIDETDCTSKRDSNDKPIAVKKGILTVRCFCGSEISVTPDLKATDQAIKNHVAEHKTSNDDKESFQALELLEEYLAKQVVIAASETKCIVKNNRAPGAST